MDGGAGAGAVGAGGDGGGDDDEIDEYEEEEEDLDDNLDEIPCVPLKVLEGSKDVTYQVTNYPRISAALTPPAGHMRGKAYSTDFR